MSRRAAGWLVLLQLLEGCGRSPPAPTANLPKLPAVVAPLPTTVGSNDATLLGPYQDIVPLPDDFGVAATLGTTQGEEHVWFVKVSL